MTEFEVHVLGKLDALQSEQSEQGKLIARIDERVLALQGARAPAAASPQPEPTPDFKPRSAAVVRIGGLTVSGATLLWLLTEALRFWQN